MDKCGALDVNETENSEDYRPEKITNFLIFYVNGKMVSFIFYSFFAREFLIFDVLFERNVWEFEKIYGYWHNLNQAIKASRNLLEIF